MLAGIALAGCSDPAESPPGLPVMLRGQSPATACEEAVVARAEFLRDQGAAGSEALESDIFETCTYAEFLAANAKMTDAYRYPGDGRAYIGRNCVRLSSLYRGSRLCQSR